MRIIHTHSTQGGEMKTLVKFLLLMLSFQLCERNPLFAQWIQTNGPYGGYVNCFEVSGTNLFVGTYGGVFISTNNGASWTSVNTSLTSLVVTSLAISGTNLFAGTYYGGVYLSTNNGTSWTAVNNGLTTSSVHSLAVN